MKRTVKDLVNLKGKVVLVRVDFNVPLDSAGRILDTTRIDQALPTIKYLSEQGAKVVVMSHLGRPDGYEIRKSLWQISLILMEKLSCKVYFCNTVIGQEAKDRIKIMQDGDVLLLENLRFYPEETACDMKFAKEIASLGDLYVDDAFGVAHRKHASNYGVARILPNAIGLKIKKEMTTLTDSMENPKHPFVVIVGGAKVSSKIKILKKFVEICDTLMIGGAMAYTFLVASGVAVGNSVVYHENVVDAQEIIKLAEEKGKKLLLPVDHVVIREGDKKKKKFVVDKMVDDMIGCDIGPKTIELFEQEIKGAGQIFWNGPLGLYEDEKFKDGTNKIAKAVAQSSAYSIVGGGDSVSAVKKSGYAGKIDFLSTGGGATLKYLEDGSLPCIDVIQEKIR